MAEMAINCFMGGEREFSVLRTRRTCVCAESMRALLAASALE
jgi:hypothetical protein